MRKASRILGITGGIAAFFLLLAVIYLSFVAKNAAGYDFDTELYKDLFVSSGLGIAGGIFVKKRNVLSGVLMLVGAVVCSFSVWGILPSILLLIGGILALVKEPMRVPAK